MTETIADIAVKPRPRASKPARPEQTGKTAVTLTGTSSKSSAIPAKARSAAARPSARSPRRWATACGPWKSSRRKSARPARSVAGGSGNRIRLGSGRVTNGGNETDLVIAFNEQVLLGRVRTGELKPDCTILLESMWRESKDPKIVAAYIETYDQLVKAGYKVIEIPMERECRRPSSPTPSAARTCSRSACSAIFTASTCSSAASRLPSPSARRTPASSKRTSSCWTPATSGPRRISISNIASRRRAATEPQIVVNGNTALALGVLASGMEICAMYPITPATSVSHYLSSVFEKVGGIVHQAEDEIAACAFAIGASYAGKCAVTVTSGPGYSLKQEAIGLAVMGEIPLVVINVQRGGPSTGQPTKVEQGDLMTAIFGSHGDAPKVVIAPATIEDCFYSVITARKIAETFNMVVVVLSDASLASSQQPFPRPQFSEAWLAPPIDQSEIPAGLKPYDWNEKTGLARRFIPGQPGGMHTLTGLAHDRLSHVAYDPDSNESGMRARSLKLAALQKTLKTPPCSATTRAICWSSAGAAPRARSRKRSRRCAPQGRKVSSLHLTFLQPMAPGIKEIMQKFKKVITIEGNWSDDPKDEIIDENNRRHSALAMLLRSRYLIDVDSWSEVRGQPIKPATIERVILEKLKQK